MTPSKSFQNWPATIQANFRKICMELSERDGAYTDLPTCLHKQSDFWHRTFFMFFFLNMPTNPIISQILAFVTTQFSSLSFQEHMKNRCQQCHLCPIHTKAETRLNAVWLKRFKFVFFLKVVYYTFIGIM